MEEIRIYCENTQSYVKVAMGNTLKDLAAVLFPDADLDCGLPVLAALVDNKLKSLDYKIINPHNVRFIGYDHPDGRRTYIRSLCFVLQNVVREMFPDKVLAIDYSLPSGLYCDIREPEPTDNGLPRRIFLTDEQIEDIEARMREIVDADLPFGKKMLSLEECCLLFGKNNQKEKVNLLKSIGRFNYNVYFLDGQADTFYGPLVPSTGLLTTFNLMGFNDGFCLQYPLDGQPGKVLPMKRQSKIASALNEYSDWCAVMGMHGVGSLNARVHSGKMIDLINLSEALHERKYAEIANQIYERRGSVKIVFIAGIIAGLRAWMPSIMSMSFSCSCIKSPLKYLFPSLKSKRGISTSLPSRRSLSCCPRKSRSMASRASKSYSPSASRGVRCLSTK